MMERAEILQGLASRRSLRLDRSIWVVAAILAGLRVAANNQIRAADRDRGTPKNQLADIWGMIGELVALRAIDEIWDGPIIHHPINFEQSVNEVDITVLAADAPVLLEAKAHLLEGGKRWFLINERAHHRSVSRGAIGYVPVLTALGAQRAIVGPLITVSEVSRWGPPDMPLDDPAIGVPLEGLLPSHFGVDLKHTVDIPRAGEIVSPHELKQWAAGASRTLSLWRPELPSLEGLHARELVDAIQAALGRINARR
jgi:hypothetical protein